MSILIARLSYHELTTKWDPILGAYKPLNDEERKRSILTIYEKSIKQPTIDFIRPHVLFKSPEKYLAKIAKDYIHAELYVTFKVNNVSSKHVELAAQPKTKVTSHSVESLIALLNHDRTASGAPVLSEILLTFERAK